MSNIRLLEEKAFSIAEDLARILRTTYDPSITSHTVMRVCLDSIVQTKWQLVHKKLKAKQFGDVLPLLEQLQLEPTSLPCRFNKLNNESLRYRGRITKPIIINLDS